MVTYYGSNSSKTTDNFVHGIECDPGKLSGSPGSYVRTNPILNGEDLKTYDHGNFQVATHDIPSGIRCLSNNYAALASNLSILAVFRL